MAKTNKHISSLEEKEGVIQPDSVSKKVAAVVKKNRKKTPSAKLLIKELLEKNKTALSRAITIIESTAPKHQQQAKEIIEACLPYASKSIRIGITGVPGVGKSTFIEAIGEHLTQQGKRIAILAIDPSSSVNKGSILGDKTRMENLVKNKDVFIRPSPSGNSLGGVARKTRETIILCEAAGFDTIIIETVGVGQSETAVHSMVDFFLLLKVAGTGDELQGIKRGIIEMADAIVINKVDNEKPNAQTNKAVSDFKNALHLYPMRDNDWQPKVTTCSALHQRNIDGVWNIVSEYLKLTKQNGYFNNNRIKQNEFWLLETINQRLLDHFYLDATSKKALSDELTQIKKMEASPFDAAERLLKKYFFK